MEFKLEYRTLLHLIAFARESPLMDKVSDTKDKSNPSKILELADAKRTSDNLIKLKRKLVIRGLLLQIRKGSRGIWGETG